MKTIKLSGKEGHGKYVLVDDVDFEWLNQWKWHLNKYVSRCTNKGGKHQKFLMHRVIMNPPKGFVTDHINNNKLDNRRSNLRIATNSQNECNKSKRPGGSSKYKGVSWQTATKQWRAAIKRIHIGYFQREEEAAKAYDTKAKELFGSFAKLNFK